jgi:hypothetical protein
MNEQERLKTNLKLLRALADGPTDLSPKMKKEVQSAIRKVGDRCLYNQGWYGARPDRDLKGQASTKALNDELSMFIELLGPLKSRGRGRPAGTKVSPVDHFIIIKFLQGRPTKQPLTKFVSREIKTGALRLRGRGTHEKRIRSLMKRHKIASD